MGTELALTVREPPHPASTQDGHGIVTWEGLVLTFCIQPFLKILNCHLTHVTNVCKMTFTTAMSLKLP